MKELPPHIIQLAQDASEAALSVLADWYELQNDLEQATILREGGIKAQLALASMLHVQRDQVYIDDRRLFLRCTVNTSIRPIRNSNGMNYDDVRGLSSHNIGPELLHICIEARGIPDYSAMQYIDTHNLSRLSCICSDRLRIYTIRHVEKWSWGNDFRKVHNMQFTAEGTIHQTDVIDPRR